MNPWIQRWGTIAFLSFLIGGMAVVFSPGPEDSAQEYGLQKMQLLREPSRPVRVAVGYNSNVDVVVFDVAALMAALGFEHAGHASVPDLAPERVAQLEDLDALLAFSIGHSGGGAAVERPVHDKALYAAMLQAALSLPSTKVYVGGNAALMAEDLASQGLPDILLGGVAASTLRPLLPPSLQLVDAESSLDEMHLVLEYPVGMRYGQAGPSRRANRVIVTRDETHAEGRPFAAFWQALGGFHPDLVLLSGLHLLESPHRADALAGMKSALSEARSFPVHLELASMSDDGLIVDILRDVAPWTDSLGLNEQEFEKIWAVLSHAGALPPLEGPHPHQRLGPMAFAPALAQLLQRLAASRSSRLSRLHFHSLEYHLVVYAQDAAVAWRRGSDPVVAGSRRATVRVCNDSATTDVRLTHGLRPLTATSWTLPGGVHVAYAPVLICLHPVKTVGTGDAISATALWYDVSIDS